MNAVPPKGQMSPKARAKTAADASNPAGESVHLTMDSATDLADDVLPERASAPPADAGRSARKPDIEPPPVPAGLANLELTLTVEVGQMRIPLRDLMSVEPGQLLTLDRMTAEPVAVLVNGKLFAHGEIVAIGERFGVRLTQIADSTGGIS